MNQRELTIPFLSPSAVWHSLGSMTCASCCIPSIGSSEVFNKTSVAWSSAFEPIHPRLPEEVQPLSFDSPSRPKRVKSKVTLLYLV